MKWNAPNVLTMLRILLIPVFVAVFLLKIPNWNIWAAIIFITASITDWLDGYLARKFDQVSSFGKLWDPTADKLLVLAALLVLMMWVPEKVGLVIVLVLVGRELLMSAFRATAAAKGIVIAADKTGKWKTATQMVAIALLLLADWPFQWLPFSLGTVLIWISVALSAYSCIEYFVKNAGVMADES